MSYKWCSWLIFLVGKVNKTLDNELHPKINVLGANGMSNTEFIELFPFLM